MAKIIKLLLLTLCYVKSNFVSTTEVEGIDFQSEMNLFA